MTYPKLIIKAHHEKRLIAGNPWIFSNEIENFSALKNLPKGQIVLVKIHNNPEFALAYFNPHSLIAGRILTHNISQKIDESFLVEKITQAQNLRQKFFNKPFYRLVNSEGDYLPGLVIDRYGDIFIIQISTAGMEVLKEQIILALREIFKNCKIIFRNNSEMRHLEKLESLEEFEFVDEIANDDILIEENDIEFSVNLKNCQKTGWFYDQRINREFVQKIAKDADIFDGFCYSGGFGVNAIRAQARSVIFADSALDALNLAKKNAQNAKEKFNQNCHIEFYQQKIFDLFENNLLQNHKFDVILLDPPAFIKSKKDLFSGLRGYEKLIRLAVKNLKNNGFLMLTSCSHHAKIDDLIHSCQIAFNKSGKNATLIRNFGASYDHPIHPALKENEYLKSLTFFVK